jgi:hypothetical protein
MHVHIYSRNHVCNLCVSMHYFVVFERIVCLEMLHMHAFQVGVGGHIYVYTCIYVYIYVP